jgi:hypothetical protein
MDPADTLATIRDHLGQIEATAGLVADAGLRVSLSGGRLDVGGLAEALGDLDAVTQRLRLLVARLPGEGGPEDAEAGERPA